MSTLLLCACGEQQQSASDKIHAGVICYNQSDTFLEQLITRFKEQLNELGGQEFKTTVTLRDAAGSQRTQNDQVKELIDAGCNVLCVNLVDRADPSEIIDLARDNDVPIIFFNREPVAEDLMQWDKLYYVGAEAKQSGVMQGELAADVIQANSQIDRNKDGKIQYVVLEGEPGHQDAIIRTENAVDTLKNKGIELEKLSYGIANWNRAQAQNRMLLLISQYQSKIELVLANNDDMALGGLAAFEQAGRSTESVLFLGVDASVGGCQAIAEGRMDFTVYQPTAAQITSAVEAAIRLASGRTISDMEGASEDGRYILIPFEKVDRQNVAQYQ